MKSLQPWNNPCATDCCEARIYSFGIAVIHPVPYWLVLGALFITGAATIVYMIGFKMLMYSLLSGIVVVLGIVLWLATVILKSDFYIK